jgi:D-beta-D-heptose 7-phosphate kinase/D-beta-D-heptose 1-phosphate adenosyltransferase
VLRFEREEYRLGGAGAVAAMCRALGAEVTLLGIGGEDDAGDQVRELLRGSGIRSRLIDDGRPTTLKERIVGVASGRHFQQLARIDREACQPLTHAVCRESVIPRIAAADFDIVLVSDYAKGVCTPAVLASLRSCGRPVIADPCRGGDWRKYRRCAALVPNRVEAGFESGDDHGEAACAIARRLGLAAVVVKLDEEGCVLAERGVTEHFPTRAREVHDVCGAGDQFLAVLGVARAGGADWREAVERANVAAGLQVERRGCVPVTTEELEHAVHAAGAA